MVRRLCFVSLWLRDSPYLVVLCIDINIMTLKLINGSARKYFRFHVKGRCHKHPEGWGGRLYWIFTPSRILWKISPTKSIWRGCGPSYWILRGLQIGSVENGGEVIIWRPKGTDFVHPPLWVFMTPSLRDPKVSPSLLTILYDCSDLIII